MTVTITTIIAQLMQSVHDCNSIITSGKGPFSWLISCKKYLGKLRIE